MTPRSRQDSESVERSGSLRGGSASLVPVTTKVHLSDADRALIRRRSDKQAYVAILHFRGPRGRRYRASRTPVRVIPETVTKDVAEMRLRHWKDGAYISEIEYLIIGPFGNVVAPMDNKE